MVQRMAEEDAVDRGVVEWQVLAGGLGEAQPRRRLGRPVLLGLNGVGLDAQRLGAARGEQSREPPVAGADVDHPQPGDRNQPVDDVNLAGLAEVLGRGNKIVNFVHGRLSLVSSARRRAPGSS